MAVGRNRDFPQQPLRSASIPIIALGGASYGSSPVATEIIQLYHKQLNLLVLCNIAGLKVVDLIDYARGKERMAQLRRELETMVRTGKRATA